MSTGTRPRVVLLGASNLTLGLATVVATARRRLGGGPLEVLVAAGHGRSYGRRSRVLVRALPGILDCGLWERVGSERGTVARALVADVGNDLGYGEPAERVAGWVDECVVRLRSAGAAVTVVRLPLPSLERLSRWRFEVVRRLLYPGRSLRLGGVLVGARRLDRLLTDLAGKEGIEAVVPDSWWYGVDAIHLRRKWRQEAWGRILASWGECDSAAEPPAGERWRLARSAPERRWLWGMERWRKQPSTVLADGTTVALF